MNLQQSPPAWTIADGGPIISSPDGAFERLMGDAGGPRCDALYPASNLTCDRQPGHTGRHASYGPSIVIAVWP